MAQTIAAPAAPTTPLPGRLGYQPALDGVRALAISLVVLFHYPWNQPFYRANPVHGGFLGVDVFFVLSGFLITTLLLQEHASFGVPSLRRFYARRALRLSACLLRALRDRGVHAHHGCRPVIRVDPTESVCSACCSTSPTG